MPDGIELIPIGRLQQVPSHSQEFSDRDLSQTQDAELSFGDLLDVINPLQHIPIVNTIYRALTGDEISTPARIIGGTLYGGPVGMVSSIVNGIAKEATGSDIGETLFAAVGLGEEPLAQSGGAQIAQQGAVAPQAPPFQQHQRASQTPTALLPDQIAGPAVQSADETTARRAEIGPAPAATAIGSQASTDVEPGHTPGNDDGNAAAILPDFGQSPDFDQSGDGLLTGAAALAAFLIDSGRVPATTATTTATATATATGTATQNSQPSAIAHPAAAPPAESFMALQQDSLRFTGTPRGNLLSDEQTSGLHRGQRQQQPYGAISAASASSIATSESASSLERTATESGAPSQTAAGAKDIALQMMQALEKYEALNKAALAKNNSSL